MKNQHVTPPSSHPPCLSRRAFLRRILSTGGALSSLCWPRLFLRPARATVTTPLLFQFDWLLNVQFAGILLAEQRGWYRERGIDLSLQPWRHGIDVIETVTSRVPAIGDIDAPAIILARARGIPVKAIATMFQVFPWGLMTLKESGIRSLHQLKGKRIGLHNFPNDLHTLEVMLTHAGLSLQDVSVVKVDFDFAPFLRGEIDAMQSYIIDEPAALKAQGVEVNVIRASDHGYTMYAQVFFCTEQMIQTRPELVKTFLETSFRGWRVAINTPEATARMVIERYYPGGDLSHQIESLKLIRYLVTKGVGEELIGMMNRTVWEKSIQLLLRSGLLKAPLPPEEVFTLQFLKAIYGF